MRVTDPGRGWSDGLLEAGLGSERAATAMSWTTRIARMLDVEVALARVQQRRGLITADQAEAIADGCDPDRVDLTGLAAEAATSASPVIALLAQVRPLLSEDARAVLHLGATSQDIVDSATMLQLRDAFDVLEGDLLEIAARCAVLADEHRGTVMPGRTLKQQAVPITFGLVAARWLAAIDRRVSHLRLSRPRVLVVQFGGAAGTLGSFPGQGPELVADLAAELGLDSPELPWHAERDRIVEVVGVLAGINTVVSKQARDIVDLSATEVGEVITAPRNGPGSSAMPHKGRNPVDAMAARAAARLSAGELSVLMSAAGEHEHERAAGAWQAEWVALPSAVVRVAGAVERLSAAIEVLQVDGERGRRNLTANLGLTSSEHLAGALAGELGRPAAQALVGELAARALQEHRALGDVAAADEKVLALLSADQVREVCDPGATLGNVDAFIDRAIHAHRTLVSDNEVDA